MEKIKSKHSSKRKNNIEKDSKEKEKYEIKKLLIGEIDKLIVDMKGFSNELINLSNNLQINNIGDTENLSKCLNNMIKVSMDKLNNQMEKFDFLNKKRNSNDKEDKKQKINLRICEYNNKFKNIIGYHIKCEILDINIKFGPWNNLESAKKVKNKLIGKIGELKLNDVSKKEEIEKFYDDFKNKIYIKYPPMNISE